MRTVVTLFLSLLSVVEELFIKRRRPALIYWDAKRRRKETDFLGGGGMDRRKNGGKEGGRVGRDGALHKLAMGMKRGSDKLGCHMRICRPINVSYE